MIKQSEIRPEIAFYIGLKNVKKSIENADLNIGNPGVGGTQYLFLLTVKKYNEKYNGKRAILLSDSELSLKDDAVPYAIVNNEVAAIEYCEKQNVKVLMPMLQIQLMRNTLTQKLKLLYGHIIH